MVKKPEEQAREHIDEALVAAGWEVQDRNEVDLSAGRGVAVREFPLVSGFGFADYLLYLDGKAAGVIEAKKLGTALSGVEAQSERYSKGLPPEMPAHLRPLPFCRPFLLRVLATALLLEIGLGCASGRNTVTGRITPEHFEFTQVVKKPATKPGGWRALCIHGRITNGNSGAVGICKFEVGVPMRTEAQE